MRIADFRFWLPITIAAMVDVLLFCILTGRCGELLSGAPPP